MVPSVCSPSHHRLLLLLGLFYIPSILAIGTDDQVNAAIDYGTFEDPSSNVRARFRYWVNDASVNLSRVADDVKSLAQAGAGGLELLGYYLYGDTGTFGGGSDAPLQADWTLYGFGEQPWSEFYFVYVVPEVLSGRIKAKLTLYHHHRGSPR